MSPTPENFWTTPLSLWQHLGIRWGGWCLHMRSTLSKSVSAPRLGFRLLVVKKCLPCKNYWWNWHGINDVGCLKTNFGIYGAVVNKAELQYTVNILSAILKIIFSHIVIPHRSSASGSKVTWDLVVVWSRFNVVSSIQSWTSSSCDQWNSDWGKYSDTVYRFKGMQVVLDTLFKWKKCNSRFSASCCNKLQL